jgi:hypothetical protein
MTDPTTRIAALRLALEKGSIDSCASCGHAEAEHKPHRNHFHCRASIEKIPDEQGPLRCGCQRFVKPNAELIVLAVNSLPWLLEVAEERDRLRAALEEIAAPPRDDDSDTLDILQEHWSIARGALRGPK